MNEYEEIRRMERELLALEGKLKLACDALVSAYQMMNYLGDILNGHDMALPEDVGAVTPGFETVRAALEQLGIAPETVGELELAPQQPAAGQGE